MTTTLQDKRLVASRFDTMVTNSVYSSLMGLIKQYIQSLFPPEFFNIVYVLNAATPVTEIPLTDDDKQVVQRPALVLNMNYNELDASFNGDPFLMGNMIVRRDAAFSRGMYQRLIWDLNNHIYVSALESRTKNSFSVNIVLNTAMQALNIKGFLKARLGEKRPFFLNNRPIEVPLPSQLIYILANSKGFDLSIREQVLAFNELLTSLGDGNITYKVHSSSGQFLYFYRYRTNLLINIANYDDIMQEREGKSELVSNVRFTLEVEYSNHVNFILESYNLPNTGAIESDYIMDDGMSAVIHWTMDMPFAEQLENGRKLIFRMELVTDVNTSLDQSVFKDQLNSTIINYIEYLKETNIPFENKLDIFLYKNYTKLTYGIDYTIDWNTYTLNILNPFINYDYRFFIYADISEINSLRDQNIIS